MEWNKYLAHGLSEPIKTTTLPEPTKTADVEWSDAYKMLFINGSYCRPSKGGSFITLNPATDEPICRVANGTAEDINKAVMAAKACLYSDTWGYKSTGAQRAIILRKLGEIITSRKDELARLDSLDQGKPLREASADLGDAISACEHFANLAELQDKQQNEVIENGTNGDFITQIQYEPIGVVGAITPWNYPFLMGIWKVIPAIAAGCTVVLKPSELAPLSCLLLAEMCTQAGLPNGAINVITGLGADAGGPLSCHDEVDKLSFTGSGPTAKRIMAAAALGPRAISLELGGKSPLIVFEDADIPSAVDWIMTGILWGSGQVCSATSRVLVHTSICHKLLNLLLEKIAAVKIGNSLDPEMIAHSESGKPTMGPVVSRGQYERIWGFIDEAKAQGIQCVCGGDRSTVANLGKGYFIPPTVSASRSYYFKPIHILTTTPICCFYY